MSDIWSTVHNERTALAEQLADLDESRWGTASLCAGWSVRDVLAHMTATAKITPPAFFGKIVRSGFSLGKMQEKDIAVERGASGADALGRFRAVLTSTKHPPGPNETWLGEVLVHSEDIRRPLGLTHAYPADAAALVASSYAKSNLVIGGKRRIDGLALKATDTDWHHGEGAAVSGPIMGLLLAMTGRKSALDDLQGEGVATLRSRP